MTPNQRRRRHDKIVEALYKLEETLYDGSNKGDVLATGPVDEQETKIVVMVLPDDGLQVLKIYWDEYAQQAKAKVELRGANLNALLGYFLKHYRP